MTLSRSQPLRKPRPIWAQVAGEPIRGVGVLMLMHLAIAFVAYPALVRLAPEDPALTPSRSSAHAG